MEKKLVSSTYLLCFTVYNSEICFSLTFTNNVFNCRRRTYWSASVSGLLDIRYESGTVSPCTAAKLSECERSRGLGTTVQRGWPLWIGGPPSIGLAE